VISDGAAAKRTAEGSLTAANPFRRAAMRRAAITGWGGEAALPVGAAITTQGTSHD